MKFPKSMHAEGWASHLETTKPEHLSDALKSSDPAIRPAVGASRFKPTGAGAKISATAPLHTAAATAAPRVDPVFARPAPAVVAVQRDSQMSWMIPAGAGAAIIAAVAIWAMNRPSEAPVTSPTIVVGSTEPQTEVAAVTPLPEAPAASQVEDSTTTTVAAAPTPAEPSTARLGLPVTTSRPAVEARPVAQAPVPTARPDMVLRSAPTSPVATLPPPVTVAAAPVQAQPLSVPPGSAPIVMPPTAAGPVTTQPVAAATPDTTASSVATGSPPLAQVQAQPQPQPVPEDSGITAKVRMALAADPTLSAVPIAVSTDHGVVKLEGQAPDAQTRERATFVVAGTSGVKAIDNRLTLPPATVVGQAPTSLQ